MTWSASSAASALSVSSCRRATSSVCRSLARRALANASAADQISVPSGQDTIADDMLSTMRSVGHTVSETNPFADPPPTLKIRRGESPYVARIRLMWESMRGDVIAAFPPPPGLPAAPEVYMAAVKDSCARCLQLAVHRGVPRRE